MIAITQQQKEEWEAKIVELEKHKFSKPYTLADGIILGSIYELKEFLSKAIILPVEENWGVVTDECMKAFLNYKVKEGEGLFETAYPNGVIIKSK